MKIELLKFENDLADFEVFNGDELVTCHASIGVNSLHSFLDGEFTILPYAWFDAEGEHIDKPDWFKRKELNLLNEAFEVGYKEVCEKMVDDQGGL